ncbi:hypothetical protein P152DRAFT_324027 [Eremomyces bilateralis CBS 781.70]|uniref:Uncharacterized protein n=1 Tax=Eremomyces bilateralis CBS 781.70 TaxID=1392243 RepID=A0A6G1G6J9_9PEZI|nr:uncharacterized protein P152DRAFT_324027 [Eremomyces bilateralis CBS 781.70]KAF1813556.1 hypothetical protein P152DRAFT_324027 [Eremomyces bilateralis CBS 781.70]
MGAMSQFKLLNVIKRRRAKKELDRQRHAEMREQEENEIGRRMQQDLVKEVAQWENLYGNKSRAEACDSSITESDGSQKYSNSADQLHKSHGHDIELADMPQAWSGPSSGATSRRISDTLGAQSNGRSTRPVSVNRTQSGQNSGPSTRPVSVNRNQSVPSSGANTRPVSAYQSLPVQSNDPTMRPVSMNRSQSTPRVSEKGTSTRNGLLRVSTASVSRNTRGDDRNSIAVGPKQSSARSSVRLSSSSPAILPLPLAAIQRRSRVEEEQASISTAQESTQEVRHGIKRISGASAFKRLSTVSSRPDPAESQEDLIPSADDNDNDDDRASSIAATLDEEEILDSAASALSLPLSVVEEGSGSQKDAADRAGQGSQSSGGTGTHPSGPGATDHATEESSETLLSAGPQIEISKDGSEGKWLVHGGLSKAENKIEDGEERIKAGNRSKRPKSGVSVAQSDAARPVSASGSLKEHLPDKLSKAAMLYRTNEWTKGWEVAEAPEEDRLSRSSSPGIQIDPAFVYAAQAEANKPIVSPVVDMRDHVEVPGLVRQSLVRPSSAEPFHRNSKNMSGLRTSYSNAPFPELQRPSLALHAHANQRLAGLSQQNVHVRANLGKRMSSAPLMLSGALQPAIDEANEASFARSSTPTLHLPASLRLSQSASPMLLPRASNTSLNQQSRFSGDLQSFDSHQPKGHSGFDAQRRDTNLAVWRSSMSQLNRLQTPIVDDGRRTAMIQEQRMRQMEEMQKKSVAAYRNSVFDVQMRSGNMIGAHRDVLRRMQEKANKNA